MNEKVDISLEMTFIHDIYEMHGTFPISYDIIHDNYAIYYKYDNYTTSFRTHMPFTII